MKQEYKSFQFSDSHGNPEGGTTFGPGFSISWQRGPLGRDAERIEPNGAFVETILEAAADRLAFYQKSKFASDFNKRALYHIGMALNALEERTASREERKVEGTLEV